MRLFLSRFFLFFSIGILSYCVIIVSFIAFTRHGFIFLPPKEEEIALQMRKGYHVVPAHYLNDRILKKELCEHIVMQKPLFLLGNSTILNFQPYHLEKQPYLNLAVTSGRIPDLLAFYFLTKKGNKQPNKYLIGVDPDLFHGEALTSLKANTTWWSFLFPECAAEMNELWRYETSSVSFIAFSGMELLSLTKWFYYFDDYFLMRLNAYIHDYHFFLDAQKIQNWKFAYSKDGSRIYPIDEEEMDTSIINQRAREYVMTHFQNWFSMKVPSASQFRVFEALVRQMVEDGNMVYLIKLPFHPILYREMEKEVGIIMVDRWLDSLARRYPIYYEGSWDPAYWGVGSLDFYDGTHLNLKGMEKVVGKLRYFHAFLNAVPPLKEASERSLDMEQ